jgi:hypothetical protein
VQRVPARAPAHLGFGPQKHPSWFRDQHTMPPQTGRSGAGRAIRIRCRINDRAACQRSRPGTDQFRDGGQASTAPTG